SRGCGATSWVPDAVWCCGCWPGTRIRRHFSVLPTSGVVECRLAEVGVRMRRSPTASHAAPQKGEQPMLMTEPEWPTPLDLERAGEGTSSTVSPRPTLRPQKPRLFKG